MAFNVNELNVIRSYLAVNGELPDQSVLNAAFDSTSLTEALIAIGSIPPRSQVSNADFVQDLYDNAGLSADPTGLNYWVSLLRDSNMPRAELVGHFQFIAKDNGGFADVVADAEAAGLVGSGSEFEEVAGPGDGDGDSGETPTELYTDVEFNVGEVQFTQEGSVAGHSVFNLGWDALNEGAALLSKDYTFTLRDQINTGSPEGVGAHSKFDAYFLSPLLEPTASFQGSRLEVRIGDRLAPADDKEATLENVQVNDFSINLNGKSYTVEANDENGLAAARNYADLLVAVKKAVEQLKAENPELVDAGLTVSLGDEFTTDQYDENDDRTGELVRGDSIIFEVTKGTLNKELFTATVTSGSGGGSDGFARAFDKAGDTVTGNIETNLVLDNVGYGSQGGSVNVSGQSASDKGIEIFNVDAKNGVWLTHLSSNPLHADFNALEVINLTGSGYFNVGDQDGKTIFNRSTVDQMGGADGAREGLIDVRQFNGEGFDGDIRLDAYVSEDVIARDLNLVDTQGNGAQDNVTYDYNLGGGNDVLFLSVSQTLISHEDAAVDIQAGSGNDQIVLQLEGDASVPSNWYPDHKDLDNIVINSGSGNDVIMTPGFGDATILAGSGNDVVYTDNTGGKADWVFNAQNTDTSDLRGDVLTKHLLYKSSLTVTFSGANVGGGVTGEGQGGTSDNAAVAARNGFESVVTIPTSNLYGTERSINQAIKDAINNDDVLNKLLVAKDGPDNTLIVESLIDGTFEADDLRIDIAAADLDKFSSSEKADLVSAYKVAMGDSTVSPTDADLQGFLDTGVGNAQASGVGFNGNSVLGSSDGGDNTGSASVAESNNLINMGTGEDVLVLGTGSLSNDTLVWTGYNNGHNTIVNFMDDLDETSVDYIDFDAYLNGKTNASGSTESVQDIAQTVASVDTFNANAVSFLTQFDFTAVEDETWSNLTEANLLAALKATTGGYANANGTNFSLQDNVTDLVGSVRDHVVLVENNLNAGEYKIFHVTSTELQNGNEEFTSAKLVGVADFGDSIDLADGNLAGNVDYALV